MQRVKKANTPTGFHLDTTIVDRLCVTGDGFPRPKVRKRQHKTKFNETAERKRLFWVRFTVSADGS